MKARTPADAVALGIIGAGQVVRHQLEALAAAPAVRVVAVTDLDGRAAREIAGALGADDVVADYQSLLRHPAVEAVYVATPPRLHRPMILEAIAAERHVLCEKPFVLNAAEAREVAAAAARRPALIVASCSSRMHFGAAVQSAHALIARGGLGRLLGVRHLVTCWPRPPRPPGWKTNRAEAGGGAAMDWGVYHFEFLRRLLGDAWDPVSVAATTEAEWGDGPGLESGFSTTVVCRSGLRVQVERRCEIGPLLERTEVRGTEGGLDVPMLGGAIPETLTRHCRAEDGRVRTESGLTEPVKDHRPMLLFPLLDFAAAVRGRAPAATSPASELGLHLLLDALYVSAARGGIPVDLPV